MKKKRLGDIRRNLAYIKVGIFFLGALLLVFIALLSMPEMKFFRGTYPIRIRFEFAEGLRPASPVRFLGVNVGEVDRVDIRNDADIPHVVVHANIQRNVKIPEGSYFFINSLSLFGEKYLEINPPEEITGYLSENAQVEGVSPTPLFSLFTTFHQTMGEIQEFVQEGEIKTSFENTMKNLEDITLDLKGLVKDVRNKQGTVGRLLYDDSLYQVTEEFIRDLKKHPWKLLHKPE
ncbi:MAG: MCE family protein [Candidatus Omnitrophica bacterium]|nr:MCE family protein [Candidatus Omnitrophota bacterium]